MLDDCYIAFVNMDHRTDRLAHMTSELQRVGIKANRVRGKLPKECYTPACFVMAQRTPGAIGCHFSQVSIMETAKKLNKHAFIMEDDLIFCSDFTKRIDYISDWMSKNEWDVFWLGATFHDPPFWHPRGQSKMRPNCSANLGRDYDRTPDNRIVRTYGAFCTYAYIVNKDSIEMITGLLDKYLHESIGIDWLFIKIQPQIKAYAFVPGSVKQMDGQSDIGTGITRFSGFSRLNGTEQNSRYWWQNKIEDFSW